MLHQCCSALDRRLSDADFVLLPPHFRVRQSRPRPPRSVLARRRARPTPAARRRAMKDGEVSTHRRSARGGGEGEDVGEVALEAAKEGDAVLAEGFEGPRFVGEGGGVANEGADEGEVGGFDFVQRPREVTRARWVVVDTVLEVVKVWSRSWSGRRATHRRMQGT